MAGLGKLLKQAQKMQKAVEEAQAEIAAETLEVSAGGDAVGIKISGNGEFQALSLDPEFLKEDAELVEETLLAAIRDAADKAKTFSNEKMEAATAGMPMPGLPGMM